MDSDAFLLPIAPDWQRFLEEAPAASVWRFTEDSLRQFWKYVDEEAGAPGSYAKCGYLVFGALRLMLFDDRPEIVSRMLDRAIELALTIDRPGMIRPDYRHLPADVQAELAAPFRLRAHVMRAVAETVQRGRPPNPTLLAEGAEFVAAAYRGRSGKLKQDSGKAGVLLATLCALLSGNIDRARELLAIRSTHPDQPRQFSWLKRAVVERSAALKAPGSVVQAQVTPGQREFYDLFNAYRVPYEKDKQRALQELPLTDRDPFVVTYLLAWVHWTIYTVPPREHVELSEIRRVLTV